MQARRGASLRTPVLAAISLGVVALDQLTKLVVVRTLAFGESRPVIDDVLRLTHVRNPGAAFGILRGFGGLLALAAVVGVIGFAALIARQTAPLTGVAGALVAGGALGNLVDRLFRGPIGRGSVVDFVDFRFWPAFNVADSAITVGAVLLLIASFVERKPSARTR